MKEMKDSDNWYTQTLSTWLRTSVDKSGFVTVQSILFMSKQDKVGSKGQEILVDWEMLKPSRGNYAAWGRF